MGNIISNTSGVERSVEGQIDNTNLFGQHMTDILLELDLLNTGNNTSVDPISVRSEFNFSNFKASSNVVTKTATGTSSIDASNKPGRPTINGNYIDIIGLPYETNEIENPESSIPKFKNYSNKYYNIKRAVCNASIVAPVDILGVDLPVDDPELNGTNSSSNFSSSQLIKEQQKLFPTIPANMAAVVDNCLTWGKTTAESGPKPKIPDLSIYKSSSNPNSPTDNLKLNDYSNITSANKSYTPHNIYDKELSDECVKILNNLMINSYAVADITKYSKWPAYVKKANINSTNINNTFAFIHDPTTGVIDMANYNTSLASTQPGADPSSGGTKPISGSNSPDVYPNTAAIFAQGKVSSASTSNQNDMNQTCKLFENDLCNWYYYYDINDGLNNNPTSPITSKNAGQYQNNFMYLNQHIPDCKCNSYYTMIGSAANGVKFNDFYGGSCAKPYNYGAINLYPNGTSVNRRDKGAYLKNDIPLYDITNNDSNYVGYKRQFDPITQATSNRADGLYSIVGRPGTTEGGTRDSATVNNSYVCNQTFNPTITGTGGNATIANITMTCGTPTDCSGGQWVNSTGAQCSANTCNPADGTVPLTGTIEQTFTTGTAAANGGKECMAPDPDGKGTPIARKAGDKGTKKCSGPTCPKQNCVFTQPDAYKWSACIDGKRSASITITTPANYGGTACPTKLTVEEACTMPPPPVIPVNCVGSWSDFSSCPVVACGVQGYQTSTYTITTKAANGGAECPAGNNQTRSNPCPITPCIPKDCEGNWQTPETAKCSSNSCDTPGTINQVWVTTKAAINGGRCPSGPNPIPCGPPNCPTSGTIVQGSGSTTSSSSGASCTTLCPTISGIYLQDPSSTTESYTVELNAKTLTIPAFSTIQVTMVVSTSLYATFLQNYEFLMILASNPDPTNGIVCSYTGSSCTSVQGACNPYKVRIPFMYGSTSKIDSYQLMIRNKPGVTANPIKATSYTIPMKLQQYSMSIKSINITNISGKPFMSLGINLNTNDNIIVSARIILTPVSSSGQAVILSQFYPNLISAVNLNNGLISIGTNQTILPVTYNYQIMINETISTSSTGTTIYSNGNAMIYEQSFPTDQKLTVDFSKITSKFTSINLQYLDNNNTITNIATNDTLILGSTLLYSWVFNSVDAGLTTMKIYYDTNPDYVPSSTASSSSVLIQSTTLGTVDLRTNNYSSTINFICPFISINNQVIFYAVASGTSTSIYSSAFKISIPQVSSKSTINNWQIIINSTSSDMKTLPANSLSPILDSNQTIPTINNYFSAGKTGNFKYVIYNPANVKWYGSNNDPVAFTTTSSSSSAPTYTIFKSPFTGPTPTITITNIKSTVDNTSIYSTSTTNPITLEIGAELTLSYQIINITSDTDFQLKLSNKIIDGFVFKQGASSTGNITFTVFGDLTVTNPKIILTANDTWNSAPISIKLNNHGALKRVLSAASATPASSLTLTNISNPAINISAPNGDSVISTISIGYAPMSENLYFTQLNAFQGPLTAKNITLTFSAFDFRLPFSYWFYSTETETYGNKLKKHNSSISSNMIETYTEHLSDNSITVDTLTLDFTSTRLDTLNTIELAFSKYTSVTITNLILVFGTLSLDNKKFNISIISDSITNTKYVIGNIVFIGKLNTSLIITSKLPGSPSINYSVNQIVSNNYALILPLVYSNGSYNLPENYQSQLTTVLKPATTINTNAKPVIAPPSITQAPAASSSDTIGTILSLIPGLADFLNNLSLATGQSVNTLAMVLLVIILIILYLLYSTIFTGKKKK